MPEDIVHSEYEIEIARAMAAHPDLVCLDARLLFSKGPWMDSEEVEEDDFTTTTYRAEVIRLWLLDDTRRKMLGMHFGKRYEFSVYSSKAQFLPRSKDYIVEAFPLTREAIIDVSRKYISATPYAKERSVFLFGSELVSITE